MIKIKIDNGKCECEVDGKPAVIAAELVQIEKAVFEQITKNGLIDLTAFGIVYHALLKTIAEDAYKKANLNVIARSHNAKKNIFARRWSF